MSENVTEEERIRIMPQKSAEGKEDQAVGGAIEVVHKPKGGATHRPSRERRSKARTVPRKGNKGEGKYATQERTAAEKPARTAQARGMSRLTWNRA